MSQNHYFNKTDLDIPAPKNSELDPDPRKNILEKRIF